MKNEAVNWRTEARESDKNVLIHMKSPVQVIVIRGIRGTETHKSLIQRCKLTTPNSTGFRLQLRLDNLNR
jgi:hypothetical protein